MRLSDLSKNATAIVLAVEDHHFADSVDLSLTATASTPQASAQTGTSDMIAHRLKELGFVPGESVRLITSAPFGGDPLLVQVGFTRFALRRSEAARVLVEEVAP